jgi:hypothetical protein
MINKEDFLNLRKKLNDLMFDGDFTLPKDIDRSSRRKL